MVDRLQRRSLININYQKEENHGKSQARKLMRVVELFPYLYSQ